MSKNDPHILGKERIGKLLLQYSIPAIIGMTITSIYNIIDSIFIGHGVGPMAIAGLAMSFPSDESGGRFLYTGFGWWVHPRLYPFGTERYERSYGNPVAHADALYHKFLSSVYCLLSSWMIYWSFSVPAPIPSICPQLYAGDFTGNSHHLYDDRAEQRDACHRISQEGYAYFHGNGGLQHHPRSYLYLPLRMGNEGCCYGNGHLAVDRYGVGSEPFPQERQYGTFEGKIWKMKP